MCEIIVQDWLLLCISDFGAIRQIAFVAGNSIHVDRSSTEKMRAVPNSRDTEITGVCFRLSCIYFIFIEFLHTADDNLLNV